MSRTSDSQTLINEHTWTALSTDSRCLLSTMLPPTAFPFFRPSLDPRHPANTQSGDKPTQNDSMDVDSMALASEPDLSFLTDPFFEAGAKTFQVRLNLSTASIPFVLNLVHAFRRTICILDGLALLMRQWYRNIRKNSKRARSTLHGKTTSGRKSIRSEPSTLPPFTI